MKQAPHTHASPPPQQQKTQTARYYYYHNSGLQQQFVLYSLASLAPGEPPALLLDPNTLSDDGTVALRDASFSEDGASVAYSLSSGGSDWCSIKVLRVDAASGAPAPLDDELLHVKFSSMAWTHDGLGFFYNRYGVCLLFVCLVAHSFCVMMSPTRAQQPPLSKTRTTNTHKSYPQPEGVDDLGTETASATHQQLVYHAVGTPQASDAVVLRLPEHPTWMSGAEVTDDGRYLLVYVTEG